MEHLETLTVMKKIYSDGTSYLMGVFSNKDKALQCFKEKMTNIVNKEALETAIKMLEHHNVEQVNSIKYTLESIKINQIL